MGSYEKLQDDTIETVTNSVPTRAHAPRRFLGAAGDWRADFRPRHRAAGQRRRDARSVPGQHHPRQPHQPDRGQRPAITFPAANQAGAGRPVEQLLRRAAVDLRLQPAVDAHRSRMDVRSIAPTAASSATSGARSAYNFAGEINGVEISRGGTDRFNYNYAVGHTAVLSPSLFLDVKGSWLRFNDDLHPIGQLQPSELGYPASTLVAAGRLPAHSALLDRVGESRPRPAGVVTLGAQQSGFNTGRAPAVLQHAVHADADAGRAATTPGSSATTGASCARRRSMKAGAAAPTPSTARTRGRRARPSISTGRASRRSCWALPLNASFIELRPEQDYSVDQPRLLRP